MAKTYRGTGTPGTSGTPVPSQADLDAAVAAAQAAQAQAEAEAAAAKASENAAELAETNAETAETNAGTSETNAAASEAAASTSETNAGTSETNAEDWANQTTGIVLSTEYSSKAYAIGGTGVTSTSGKGAAKEWAVTTGTTVDTAEYSAKEYAVGTTVAVGSAKQWASEVEDTLVDATEYSAKHYSAKAAASYDSFDDRYLGAKASDPTLDNDGNALLEGALYWNSTTSKMRVYNGASWENAVDFKPVWFIYSSSTTGQTTFTGSDDNTDVLAYVAGDLQVYYNGSLLKPSDYTATNGTSIVLTDGVRHDNDVIQIYTW